MLNDANKRPPLMKDYFDDELTFDIKARKRIRNVRIFANVDQHEVAI
jgi:hypothetical protein